MAPRYLDTTAPPPRRRVQEHPWPSQTLYRVAQHVQRIVFDVRSVDQLGSDRTELVALLGRLAVPGRSPAVVLGEAPRRELFVDELDDALMAAARASVDRALDLGTRQVLTLIVLILVRHLPEGAADRYLAVQEQTAAADTASQDELRHHLGVAVAHLLALVPNPCPSGVRAGGRVSDGVDLEADRLSPEEELSEAVYDLVTLYHQEGEVARTTPITGVGFDEAAAMAALQDALDVVPLGPAGAGIGAVIGRVDLALRRRRVGDAGEVAG